MYASHGGKQSMLCFSLCVCRLVTALDVSLGVQYCPQGNTLPLVFLSTGSFLQYPYCYSRWAPDFKLCQIHTCCASLCPTKLQRTWCPWCALSGTWVKSTFEGFQVALKPMCNAPPAFYLHYNYLKSCLSTWCVKRHYTLKRLGLNVKTTVAPDYQSMRNQRSSLVVTSAESF